MSVSEEEKTKPKPLYARRCHDCGKPCNNYRCEACWRRRRGFGTEYIERRTGGLDDEA
jgi:hypothetical protein